MYDVTNFATRTEYLPKQNLTVHGFYPVGIDYGFSGIKGFAPNKVFCFPNCAVKLDDSNPILDMYDTDIIVKDDTGTWVIGERAHEIITPTNAMNYESEMYERNRYFSPFFGALMKAGLGIAVSSNQFGKYQGEPIMVQTGLPPKYIRQDTELIKEALTGEYDFDMRIGKNPFRHYHFVVRLENVFVMDQPMGSLISTITNNDGKQSQADYRILKSNTLVFDPGFKTLDIYDISAGMFKDSNTFDTLGMHEVFKRTSDELKRKYNADVPVSNMQTAIRRGYVNSFDRRTLSSRKVEFGDILVSNAEAVCNEAIQKLLSIYNYMQNHDFLIVTGGTGNAWFPRLQESFKNMESLTILSANKNDDALSNTYSNVRGYYLYRVGMMLRNRR